MNDILGSLSRLITARPYVTLGVLLIITVILAAGAGQRSEPAETESLLPPGSAIAHAIEEIDQLFGGGEVSLITLIFRGDAITPDGLAQMSALIDKIVTDPEVEPLLAATDPIISPALMIQAALGVDSFDSVSSAQIGSAREDPRLGPVIDAMTGVAEDGTAIAVSSVRLIETGDERIVAAERRVHELAVEDEGPLRASSVSAVIVEDEYIEATETGTLPLVGIALLLIAALILLFMRTISDLLLTMTGLFISLIWVVGIEGWLGPNGAGLIGPPSGITAMVPIIVISLTVDYAIQAVSHYREQRLTGVATIDAIRLGLRNVMIPIVLAAVTTIVSLLASLFSPVQGIGDFGIIAGLGVGMSMIVMLTLLPAARTIIDRRREARGTLPPARPIANALPGINRVAEILGGSVTRRPAPYFIVVIAIMAGLGYASTGLDSEFNIRDILPRGGSVLEDMETLDHAVGGATEMTSLLIKAEATETRTLLNLRDLQAAFADEQRRPPAVAGPLHGSYETLLADWIEDSG